MPCLSSIAFGGERKKKKMAFRDREKNNRKSSESEEESITSQHDFLALFPFDFLKIEKIEIKEWIENGLKYI